MRGVAWALCANNLPFLCLLVCLRNKVANHLPSFQRSTQTTNLIVVSLVDGQFVVDGVQFRLRWNILKILISGCIGCWQTRNAIGGFRCPICWFQPNWFANRKSNRAHIRRLAVETLRLTMPCHRKCHMHIVWLEILRGALLCVIVDVDNVCGNAQR